MRFLELLVVGWGLATGSPRARSVGKKTTEGQRWRSSGAGLAELYGSKYPIIRYLGFG